MSVATEGSRVVHSLPGRARVHVPHWSGTDREDLERQIHHLDGVQGARASPRTRNVLIHFQAGTTDESAIVSELDRLVERVSSRRRRGRDAESVERGVGAERRPKPRGRRLRIAVRGLDRDHALARNVVERLEQREDVRRASASVLTGRVLVELSDGDADLAAILETVSELEAPEDPEEPTPSHPLDPAPMIQGSAALVGALLGLGLLGLRRMNGAVEPPVARTGPAELAGTLGIIEGLPAARQQSELFLGHDRKELAFGGLSILSLTFSGSTLGLAMAGAGALRLLTEVRTRRQAWREYEERAEGRLGRPGARVRLEAEERLQLPGRVIDGFGTAICSDGLPVAVRPGNLLDAGDKLYGGPFEIELESGESFAPRGRATPSRASALDHYLKAIVPVSLGFAALTGLLTRSLPRALTALLLVNPRPALVGSEGAALGASARVVRSGGTVVGSRPGRAIRLPDALVLDSPRLLTDGLEVSRVVPLEPGQDPAAVARLAAAVAAAAGSPWGRAFPGAGEGDGTNGGFDGRTARAEISGAHWTLGPAPFKLIETLSAEREGDEYFLLLRRGRSGTPLGAVALRPRLAAGVAGLLDACRRHGVRLEALSRASSTSARSICARAGVPLRVSRRPLRRIEELQNTGDLVALVSDSSGAGEAFAACDLAIGLTSGRSGVFSARADVLAPGLDSVAAVIDAGARRDAAVRDSVLAALCSNAAGVAWAFGGQPTFDRGSRISHLGTLSALAIGWGRTRGGKRARSVTERLSDPRPERWGRLQPDAVLRVFDSTDRGLSSPEAASRYTPAPAPRNGSALVAAVSDQLRSPLVGVLVAGGVFSLAIGAAADVAMIAAVIGANALVGAWQEREAGRAVEALESRTAPTATVLRDGRERTVAASEIVPGDILVLAPGARITADARVLEADRLELDESALTGESLPVPKAAQQGTDAGRVLLDGTDVVVGTGRAVVVAVGSDTRMGATSAALALDNDTESPLDARLGRILRTGAPIILGGGLAVTAAGFLRTRTLLPQLALGASIAIAAVPEGLPLLAGVAEAGVAKRLAGRRALVRRLSAVEALGRVDVACADKTGTLTEGRLAMTHVVDVDGRRETPPDLSPPFRDILLTAAIASPHPETPAAHAHPTDVVVVEAADRAGLEGRLRTERHGELPFEPGRSFHATRAAGRLCAKGAVEVLAERCSRIRRNGVDSKLDEHGRQTLLECAQSLSGEGLRVLMVAEGPSDCPPENPRGLTALGFLGISDPLRPTVRAAVQRCQEAGVRVIMLTGDHPATARTIALDAGLNGTEQAILTGDEIANLDGPELEERLERASVIARITPLDKLRIVETLQRRGHVVAMTGDGVNDAPALRLADVGVAMGQHGTEVAREAAEVILTDDDFSTLAEALVEGRGFWRNMRRALGLLLGGNLGELGLMVTAVVAGLPTPLTTRQILTVNLVTDVLPAVAVAVQQPEHRNLAALAREGATGLDAPLREDILRRGFATAVPSLGAYVLASRSNNQRAARSVAFASIVGTQLGQTVDLGMAEGRLTQSVGAAVGVTALLVVACLTAPPLQTFLGFATPPASAAPLVGGAVVAAVVLGRAMIPAAPA